ncbi:cystatin-like isoform X2 [Oryzias latipes]
MHHETLQAHPGTEVTAIDLFNYGNSTEPMWNQVEGFGKVIQKIMEKSPEGVHLLCFSQGGLICRGLLSTLPNHNVHSFIALSSPLAGQFGALLTVGSAQGLPGGPTDINANDPEVQAALKFAMKEYNKGSSDQYLYVVVDVIRVQGQVVAGYNYFLSVKIAKTLCRKNSNVSGCSAISNSPMAKT